MIKILLTSRGFRVVKRRKKRPALSQNHYLQNKEKAREIITPRLEYFASIYNFPYGRVSIRNQRTRWGSCSKQGNLNFNYRLYNLSPALRDYVIVHEICHLQEFNHGVNFWSLVSKACPSYKEIRRELKKIRLS